MRMRYFDAIQGKWIAIDVDAKVKHEFQNRRKEREEDRKERKKYGIKFKSIERMREVEKAELVCELTLEQEYELTQKEIKYLQSWEYKKFRGQLCDEIKKNFDKMPPMVKKSMFLRFFKNYSIAQIAKCLNIAKSTAQDYLSRGTAYIAYFLDEDIKIQDKIDREKRMKSAQMRNQRYKNK